MPIVSWFRSFISGIPAPDDRINRRSFNKQKGGWWITQAEVIQQATEESRRVSEAFDQGMVAGVECALAYPDDAKRWLETDPRAEKYRTPQYVGIPRSGAV